MTAGIDLAGLAAAHVDAPTGPVAHVENDSAATGMEYDPNAHVPHVVIAVWGVAMLALLGYMAAYLVPDLLKWGTP